MTVHEVRALLLVALAVAILVAYIAGGSWVAR